jgi:hypothetical protein
MRTSLSDHGHMTMMFMLHVRWRFLLLFPMAEW